MEPTLFSATHTYVPASPAVTLSMISELLPASSTVAPGTSETVTTLRPTVGRHGGNVGLSTLAGTVVDRPGNDRRRRPLSVAG